MWLQNFHILSVKPLENLKRKTLYFVKQTNVYDYQINCAYILLSSAFKKTGLQRINPNFDAFFHLETILNTPILGNMIITKLELIKTHSSHPRAYCIIVQQATFKICFVYRRR